MVEHLCVRTEQRPLMFRRDSVALDELTIHGYLFPWLTDSVCLAGSFQLMHVFLVFHSF